MANSMKIDAFAHVIPARYLSRLEALFGANALSERVLGYEPWLREDPALTDLDSRWRTMDAFEGYVQVLTLAVPPVEELGEPGSSAKLAKLANDEMAELILKQAKGVGANCLRSRKLILLQGFPSMWQGCRVRSVCGFG